MYWGLLPLLAQKLYSRLASVDALRTVEILRLTMTPTEEDTLCNLGNFSFVASHLFMSVVG